MSLNLRRSALFALCVLGLSLGFAWAFPPSQIGYDGPERPVIRIEDFPKSDVIGKLGVPLGHVVVIEGDAAYDGPTHKGRDGTMSLKIVSVDQQRLERPAVFLDEHLRDEAGRAVHLSQGRYRLAVYETGRFEGLPQGYEKYQLIRQGRGFHFQSELWIEHNFAEDAVPRQK